MYRVEYDGRLIMQGFSSSEEALLFVKSRTASKGHSIQNYAIYEITKKLVSSVVTVSYDLKLIKE